MSLWGQCCGGGKESALWEPQIFNVKGVCVGGWGLGDCVCVRMCVRVLVCDFIAHGDSGDSKLLAFYGSPKFVIFFLVRR